MRVAACHNEGGSQEFVYTELHEIVNANKCFDTSQMNGTVQMIDCHRLKGNQQFIHNKVVSTQT